MTDHQPAKPTIAALQTEITDLKADVAAQDKRIAGLEARDRILRDIEMRLQKAGVYDTFVGENETPPDILVSLDALVAQRDRAEKSRAWLAGWFVTQRAAALRLRYGLDMLREVFGFTEGLVMSERPKTVQMWSFIAPLAQTASSLVGDMYLPKHADFNVRIHLADDEREQFVQQGERR